MNKQTAKRKAKHRPQSMTKGGPFTPLRLGKAPMLITYRHVECNVDQAAGQLQASLYGPRPSCTACHGSGVAGAVSRIVGGGKKRSRVRFVLSCACLSKPPTGAQLREFKRA